MPEPEPEPEPRKRRGRPPGSKNKVAAPPRVVPWFTIWRASFWAIVAVISVVSLYFGVEGWLNQSIANIVLAVSVVVAGLLLDRDWKKMRGS